GRFVDWLGPLQAIAIVASLYAAHLARHGRVEVGLDGVRVVTPTRDRSFAFGDIERVAPRGASVDLELRRGERYSVRLRGENDAQHAARSLAARIAEGVAHAGASDPVVRAAGGGADRVRALRALGADANVDLRTAPVDRERLLAAATRDGARAEERA